MKYAWSVGGLPSTVWRPPFRLLLKQQRDFLLLGNLTYRRPDGSLAGVGPPGAKSKRLTLVALVKVAKYLIGEFPRLQIGVWLASLYGFRVKTLSKLVPNPTHGMHAIQVSLLQQNSLPSPQARMKPSHFTKICVTTLLKDSHTYTFQHFRDQDLLHHSGNRYARPSDTLPPSAELNLLNGKRASYRDYPPLHCLPQHVLEHASSYRIAVHLLLCHTPSCVPQGGSQLLQQSRLCIPLLRHPWQLHYVPKCGMVLEC